MIYKNNRQLVNAVKKLMLDENVKQVNLSEKIGCSKQRVAQIFNKKNLSFNDIKILLEAMQYDLVIEFKTSENKEK